MSPKKLLTDVLESGFTELQISRCAEAPNPLVTAEIIGNWHHWYRDYPDAIWGLLEETAQAAKIDVFQWIHLHGYVNLLEPGRASDGYIQLLVGCALRLVARDYMDALVLRRRAEAREAVAREAAAREFCLPLVKAVPDLLGNP